MKKLFAYVLALFFASSCAFANNPSLIRIIENRNLSRQNRLKMVKRAIKRGADLNERDSKGDTPLISACFNCYPEIVKLLLDLGADPSLKNQYGEGVLVCTVYSDCEKRPQDSIKCLKYLIESCHCDFSSLTCKDLEDIENFEFKDEITKRIGLKKNTLRLLWKVKEDVLNYLAGDYWKKYQQSPDIC